MSIWCCGPVCEELTTNATEAQAARLRKARREFDYVIACQIVHTGREL